MKPTDLMRYPMTSIIVENNTLKFIGYGGDTLMVLNGTGLGVGSNKVPSYDLDVDGNVRITTHIAGESALYMQAPSTSYYSSIYFGNPDDISNGHIRYSNYDKFMDFKVNGDSRMRIDKDGNVIHNGYTKLGSETNAPKIKMKKFEITLNEVGKASTIVHSINIDKILGIQMMVENTDQHLIPPSNLGIGTSSADYYTYEIDGAYFKVTTGTNATNVAQRNGRLIITYEA